MTGTAGDHQVYGVTKARIEALTDGIFAFAMTLLVTTLEIPEVSGVTHSTDVARIIIENIPGFLHYVIAFAALAGFWVGHHMQFHALRFVDRTMIWLNISLLLFVALVPFSADLVGDYSDIALSSLIFETNLFVIGGFMYVQWLYATEGRRLVDSHVTDAGIAAGLRRNLVLPGISLVGILLALSGVGGSTFVYLAVPPLLVLAGSWNPQGPNPP
ncbi:MAG: DUF1211 domain-containing protein [Methanomicrobiales archaeon]|nr:DUF1211 domain-containing protein [Methanomicrobiales archaeon]